jgi:hypothetical protein
MLPARLMLSGPAGSGKTRTALIIASVLADGGDILMIDTERESALTYADDFSFDHLSWHAPYDPRELAQTLHDAGERYSVVIVDSLSHYWRKAGGTLDIAEGKFSGWKVARPAQEDMVDAILGTKCHVIVSVRSKIEYTQTTDERGRHSVQKLGMAPQQDETLEYEVNLAAELDIEHRLSIAKSRTVPLPVGKVFAPGHAEEFATIYRDWLRGGEPLPSREVVDQFLSRMNALRPEIRKEAKADWLATLGKPETLRKAQVDQAEMLVAGYEAKEASIAEAPETPLNRPEIDPQTNGGSTFPTPAKLLRTAREIAQESGVEPPSNVEAIDSDLMAAALERLGVQVPTG